MAPSPGPSTPSERAPTPSPRTRPRLWHAPDRARLAATGRGRQPHRVQRLGAVAPRRPGPAGARLPRTPRLHGRRRPRPSVGRQADRPRPAARDRARPRAALDRRPRPVDARSPSPAARSGCPARPGCSGWPSTRRSRRTTASTSARAAVAQWCARRAVTAWRLNVAQRRATRIKTLVGGFPTSSGRHGGCRLLIARNGALIVGTGDAAIGTNPRDLTSYGGKTLRLDRFTRQAVADQPFGRRHDRAQRYVHTWGHRNVQGLAQRADGTLWSVEHGPDRDDEVNLLHNGARLRLEPRPGLQRVGPDDRPVAARPSGRGALELRLPDPGDQRCRLAAHAEVVGLGRLPAARSRSRR